MSPHRSQGEQGQSATDCLGSTDLVKIERVTASPRGRGERSGWVGVERGRTLDIGSVGGQRGYLALFREEKREERRARDVGPRRIMNEGGAQPAVREVQDRAGEESIRSPLPDMMTDAIPPPSGDGDLWPTPPSLTRDDCPQRSARPSGACRVASWRRTLEPSLTLPTICGPRVNPVPNYPTAHSLALDPSLPAILYHGTPRISRRQVPLRDDRSVRCRY
jgi:hypothetical protein